MLPPMPASTTLNRSPNASCIRRANTSGQRSSPFSVEAVPSVIESPNATTACVVGATCMSTASRKYQDVVEYGKLASPVSAPSEPLPGADR
jgi:hypothetical protein